MKVFLWTPHLAGFGAALKRKKKGCLERLLKSRLFFFFLLKKYIFINFIDPTLSTADLPQQEYKVPLELAELCVFARRMADRYATEQL